VRILTIVVFLFAGFFSVMPASSQNLPSCTVTGPTTTFPTGTACWGQPDFYQLRIYEAGLCSSPPTSPTTSSSPGLSSCVATFTSTAGSVVSVTPTTSSALSGVFTRPANGSYTHGYIRMDASFTIQASVDFGVAITGDAGGNGQFCATITGSTSGGTSASCAGVAPTAGTLQVPLTDFDGGAGFSASATATSTTGSGTSTINAFLMTSADQLAPAATSVQKLFGFQTFASPVTITNTTTGMDISFRMTTGMTLIGNAGPTLSIESGPFVIDMTPSP
jgi:hypothetical protein